MMTPPKFGKQRLSQHIVQHLRQLIAAGELKVGDKLPTEHQLCAQFGVSRTTLREAVQALRDQGLVNVAPGRGSCVCAPHASQLSAAMAMTAALLPTSELELTVLRLALLRTALPHLSRLPQAARHSLTTPLVAPSQMAQENAASEALWQQTLLQHLPLPTTALLLEVVLTMDAPHRVLRCQQPAYIGRLQQLHMRMVQAMTTGDVGTMERLLVTWLEAPVVQRAA